MHSKNIYRSPAGEASVRAWCDERLGSMDYPYRRSSIDTSLGRTEAVETDAGNIPVVLLPGTNFATATWLDLLKELAPDYRVTALDVPGQPGLSSSHRPSRPHAYVRWLAEALEGFGVVNPIVVGHSLGARTALAAAAESLTVRGLVLISPGGIIRLRVSPSVLRRSIAWLARRDEATAAGLLRIMTTQEEPPEHLVEWMTLVGRNVRTSFAPSPLPREVLGRVDTPCVIRSGSDDAFLPPQRLAAGIADRLPRAQLEIVAGAGHLLPYESADEVLNALRRITP